MAQDLTTGRPSKAILIYSLPIIIGNFFQQIYNLMDMVIVGRCVDYKALAGVGATSGLSFFVLWFAMGITSGLGIRIAQFFGAKDFPRLRRSVGTSLVICVAMTMVLTLLSVAFCRPILEIMGTPADIFDYSYSYIVIIFGGLFATIAYNIISCILRAIGDSRTPLYFLIFSSLLNVGLDVLFMATFGWGVRGAAWATVGSQCLSAFLCFVYTWVKYPELRLRRSDFRIERNFVNKHLNISLPMAFQFSITAFGIIILQAALNGFPSTCIAGFAAASKVQNVGSVVGVSFGVAIANYVGQNFGAGEVARARRGVRDTIFMTLGFCLLSSILISVFADPFTSIFLDKSTGGDLSEILWASRQYLYISAIFYPFLFCLFVYRNALQGIGQTFWPLIAGVAELVLRTAFSMFLPGLLGYRGILLSDVVAWAGACIVLAISYYRLMPQPRS